MLLTEHIKFKLQEILEFCEAYNVNEAREIPFIDKHEAEVHNRERMTVMHNEQVE